MTMNGDRRIVAASTLALLLLAYASSSEPLAVRHSEGLVHGFLKLSAADGTHIADGDLLQNARGGRVTSRLVFRFRDGSLHDETGVFTERNRFEFVSDHLIQKGPSFPREMDMSIDATGQATVHYTEHGAHKTATERFNAPGNLANGMLLTLLKNVQPDDMPKELPYVVATPAPKLIRLKVSTDGEDSFAVGYQGRKAMHYVLKPDIGGIQGLVAPLVGKQPPDSHVWVFQGEAPAFVKSEQTFFVGGPIWRIELTTPVWPHTPTR